MAGQGQKTEKPTPRRLEKARKDGRFPVSREFTAAMVFVAFVWLLGAYGPEWLERLKRLLRGLLLEAFRGDWTVAETVRMVRHLGMVDLAPLLAAGFLLTLAQVGVQAATTQFGFSFNRLAPDLSRLNPVPRLRQLPSQNLSAALQAVALLPLFAWAIWSVVRENLANYLALGAGDVAPAVSQVFRSIHGLLWKAALLLVAVGSIDLFRQRRRWMNELRMSKQEIRDEYKELEGNPQIKARVRRLQRELLRRRMIREVPKATAVIVNPTHYAVAIRYQVGDLTAPKVLAKGKNYLALRIRQIATEHQVPIVENPPLARSLYESVEVGQEIPPNLYQAVAEVLAYIYRLMNGRLPG